VLALITASATPAAFGEGKNFSAPEEKGIRGRRRYTQWPQAADAVIKAYVLMPKMALRSF
jgi:hypothetical protein